MGPVVAGFVQAIAAYQTASADEAKQRAITDALDRIENGISQILNSLAQLRVFISQSFVDFAIKQYQDSIYSNSKALVLLLAKKMTPEAKKQATEYATSLFQSGLSLSRWDKYGFATYHSVIVAFTVYLKACEFLGMKPSEIAKIAGVAEDYTGDALSVTNGTSIGAAYQAARDGSQGQIELWNSHANRLWRVSRDGVFELGRWDGAFPNGHETWIDTDEGTWAQYAWFENLEGYAHLREQQNEFIAWFGRWRSLAEAEAARAAGIEPQVNELRAADAYFRSLQPHKGARTLVALELAEQLRERVMRE